MPAVPPRSTPPGKARLLNGAGPRTGTDRTATAGTSFKATVPFQRPPAAARPNVSAAPDAALPRWAKGCVIGGVLLAIGMPVSVLMSRSMLVQAALAEESSSKAAMVCTGGDARAVDDSGVMGWLFGGSYFSCGDWETREARKQRERDQAHNNYMARQKARQQGY